MTSFKPWLQRLTANDLLRKIAFFVAFLAIWQALIMGGLWPEYVFPSPLSVVKTLIRGFQNGMFEIGIVSSIERILIGFGVSAVLGMALGLAIGRIKLLEETIGGVILALQALPSICWLPLAILWFGLSETAILFVVIMGALLSITIATEAGVKNTPPDYVRAARNLGARGWRMYTRVILPAALPAIITGMELGWSFAWRSLMAGELLYQGGNLGLGNLLSMGRDLNDMAQVIAVMLVIIAIGLTVDRLIFAPLEVRVRERWGLQS